MGELIKLGYKEFYKLKVEDDGLCRVEGCEQKRKKGKSIFICSKHEQNLYRYNHPIAARLACIRRRAKRKKLTCELTLEWLRKFTGDLDISDLHLDRIDSTRGYEFDNVQWMDGKANIAKGNRERSKGNDPF